MASKKVTLVLLNYNNYKYLDSCLKSIVINKENYSEVIFVDDLSTDNDRESYLNLIGKYPELEIRTIFNTENLGVKNSLLNITRTINSDFIQLLATDDLFNGKVFLPKSFSMNNIYVCPGKYVDENEVVIGAYKNSSIRSMFIIGMIYYSNPIKAPGIIVSKNIVECALERSDVNFEDWPILRHAVSCGGKIIQNPRTEILYRQHSQSLSSKSNECRLSWMNSQIEVFLNESLKYDLSIYNRIMVTLQIKWLSSISYSKIFFGLFKLLDCKRLYYKIFS